MDAALRYLFEERACHRVYLEVVAITRARVACTNVWRLCRSLRVRVARVGISRPRLTCHAVSAAQAGSIKPSLLGTDFRLNERRGVMLAAPHHPRVLATIHLTSILRAIDEAARDATFESLVADLRVARTALTNRPQSIEVKIEYRVRDGEESMIP